MGWWRTLRYWLAGGKRRWFARKAKRLPVAVAQEAGAGTDLELGGALFEAVSVGLEVDPDRALALLLACDPHVAGAYTTPSLEANREELLRRTARIASGPTWRIGWILAKRLKQPAHLTTFTARPGPPGHRSTAGCSSRASRSTSCCSSTSISWIGTRATVRCWSGCAG